MYMGAEATSRIDAASTLDKVCYKYILVSTITVAVLFWPTYWEDFVRFFNCNYLAFAHRGTRPDKTLLWFSLASLILMQYDLAKENRDLIIYV